MQGPKAYLAQQVPPPNPTSEPHYTELITQHRNIDTRLGGGQRYCLAGEETTRTPLPCRAESTKELGKVSYA